MTEITCCKCGKPLEMPAAFAGVKNVHCKECNGQYKSLVEHYTAISKCRRRFKVMKRNKQ